jgi:hypothetical protein
MEGFRTAAKIFWITPSVYARAVPEEHANILLEILDAQSAHGFNWHQKDDSVLVWSQMYNYVLDYYIDRFDFYCDQYIQSPLGQLFTEAVQKARSSGSKLPVLDEKPIAMLEGALGIQWTVAEISDIFRLLISIHGCRD